MDEGVWAVACRSRRVRDEEGDAGDRQQPAGAELRARRREHLPRDDHPEDDGQARPAHQVQRRHRRRSVSLLVLIRATVEQKRDEASKITHHGRCYVGVGGAFKISSDSRKSNVYCLLVLFSDFSLHFTMLLHSVGEKSVSTLPATRSVVVLLKVHHIPSRSSNTSLRHALRPTIKPAAGKAGAAR